MLEEPVRILVMLLAVVAAGFGVVFLRQQSGSSATLLELPQATAEAAPFKLGTFERQGRTFVGVVLDESLVIDLAAANDAVATRAEPVASPSDMKDLIQRYDAGVRARIGEVVSAVAGLSGQRPAWVHDLADLKILPPIMYPMTMMNVAVNYREHDIEMASVRQGAPVGPTGGEALPGTQSAPGLWDRTSDDPRWNPYLFLKAPAAIIAHGEAIRIPPGRDRIEWECELSVVIGRPSSHVPVEQAFDHVFGYTLMNDVSDRGGRGDERYGGSDWLVTKSHDTFAPLGPFITPKEFVPDVSRMRLTYSLNGEVLQEGTTAQMIHKVDEILSYATNILSLRPGDIIATGTLPGSGSARTPPIFFQPGDVSTCTYDGIGTLENPIEGPRASD
jgi:2-keto-4-pentenoate hydratase/2-oxohepta-3-ene-1,7-dioic acid hydratase in catechol pathway